MYEVIDLSSVCFSEHLAECQVIHVLVRGRDLEGEGNRCVLELVEVMAVGLITCGEVEDVVGALTPVVGGVAQVFHGDQVVELRLLLVAEVEEEGEEDRQEEGEEVKRGSQVEETTTTWMAMMLVVSGVRTRLELEPDVSMDDQGR